MSVPLFRGDGVGFSFVSGDGDVRRGSVFCGQDGVCFLTNLWNRVGCLSHRLWWGSCCSASRGRCLRRQTPWFRRCDGCRPSLLACSFIVFKVHLFSDVLLMVPFKLHFLRRCGGRLHGWLRSSATRKTGDSYKDLNVTSVFKFVFVRWVVNYQLY